MKAICVICGRPTKPVLFLGVEPIGPKCARDMGLTKRRAKKIKGLLFVAKIASGGRAKSQNLDLFIDEGKNDASNN